jgi:hypothetical protein
MVLSFKSPTASEIQGQMSWKEPKEDQNAVWPTVGWKEFGWEVVLLTIRKEARLFHRNNNK